MQKTDLKNSLKKLLLEKSYEKRDVILASGEKSDFYFDGKQTSLNAAGAFFIGELFYAMIQTLPVNIRAVGGPTLGADPLVTAVSVISYQKKNPLHAFIIRKEPKKHGTSQWIEGIKNLQKNDKVILLEDVVTTGKSSLEAYQKAKDYGLDVYGILAIVDREQGGADRIRQQGLYFDCLFTKSVFLDS